MDNSENEKTLIGHLIRFPEKVFETSEGLSPDYFSNTRHATIFKAIQENATRYDALLISNVLKSWGHEIPVSDLLSFEEFAIDGLDLDRIKTEIRTESQKATLSECLNGTLQKLHREDSDLSEIHETLSRNLQDLQAGTIGANLLKQPRDFREEILNPTTRTAMFTGLESLDRLLGGFRPGELTIGTGETGSGKSTLFTSHFPYRISQKQHSVLIASFEMPPAAIERKMVQMTMGRPFHELTRSEKERGLDFIEGLPLHFIDAYGRIGLQELKSAIFRARRQFGIDLVVLDHLHFFLKYSADHERQAIDAALVDLKSWAMALDLHVLLVVHPTKIDQENRQIRMNDLKGSSGLKQIPDNILSLWRPRSEDDLSKRRTEVLLHVLKVRDDAGDEGKVILNFDKRSQNYREPDGVTPSAEEGKFPASPPSSRISQQGRDWHSGYDQ